MQGRSLFEKDIGERWGMSNSSKLIVTFGFLGRRDKIPLKISQMQEGETS